MVETGLYSFIKCNNDYICSELSRVFSGSVDGFRIDYTGSSLVIASYDIGSKLITNRCYMYYNGSDLINAIDVDIEVRDIVMGLYVCYNRGLVIDKLLSI